jgi:hypothetical protein
VDVSPPTIVRSQQREAQEKLSIDYHVAYAAETIQEAARVLRPMGRFVALFSHPYFDMPGASAWLVERMSYLTTPWRKVSR